MKSCIKLYAESYTHSYTCRRPLRLILSSFFISVIQYLLQNQIWQTSTQVHVFISDSSVEKRAVVREWCESRGHNVPEWLTKSIIQEQKRIKVGKHRGAIHQFVRIIL
jgi:hypothetical protein